MRVALIIFAALATMAIRPIKPIEAMVLNRLESVALSAITPVQLQQVLQQTYGPLQPGDQHPNSPFLSLAVEEQSASVRIDATLRRPLPLRELTDRHQAWHENTRTPDNGSSSIHYVSHDARWACSFEPVGKTAERILRDVTCFWSPTRSAARSGL